MKLEKYRLNRCQNKDKFIKKMQKSYSNQFDDDYVLGDFFLYFANEIHNEVVKKQILKIKRKWNLK